jgi:hypothetical protein
MKVLKYLVLLLFLVFVSCKDTDTILADEEIIVNPTFITRLNPIDDSGVGSDISKNVIQGIAAFENGWFVTQKSGTSILLINYLDADGVSLFHKRLAINSHGQDLSLDQTEENELNLYTSKGTFGGNRNTGIYKLLVQLPEKVNDERDWSLTNITVTTSYDLNYTNATPTIDESKQHFAIRSKNTVLIHSKIRIESLDYTATSHFELNEGQLEDDVNLNMWFQGIAMKDGMVYCLTGNEKITSIKKIYRYNQSGIAEEKYSFGESNFSQTFYDKIEPEGLSIIGNNLYFTIMTKNEIEEGNIKYLYKIPI